MTVAAILKRKGTDVVCVRPTDSLGTVVQVLTENRIGAVVVCDDSGTPVGILSERDVVHALAASGAGTVQLTAEQWMTRAPHTATPSTTVVEAMAMMTAGRFRHLPVLEGGRLVGLVSIGDVVKARLEQQETEVDGLRAYVAGVG